MLSTLDKLMDCPAWAAGYEIQRSTLFEFYRNCGKILAPDCGLRPLEEHVLSLERNLFSTLFLSATLALDLPETRARFYAMVNQSMRALVTGCDNLLDDEYKEVIPFVLDGNGSRFRSVLMIMTADRILSDLVIEELAAGGSHAVKAADLSRLVLAVLIPSGIEEHEEESAVGMEIPSPAEMVDIVHYRKTGLLFEAPISLIERMGEVTAERAEPATRALRLFGLACQTLDDIRDVADDLERKQHNIVVSYAYHGSASDERDHIVRWHADQQRSLRSPAEIASALCTARNNALGLAAELFDDARRALCSFIPGFGKDQADALIEAVRSAIGVVDERMSSAA